MHGGYVLLLYVFLASLLVTVIVALVDLYDVNHGSGGSQLWGAASMSDWKVMQLSDRNLLKDTFYVSVSLAALSFIVGSVLLVRQLNQRRQWAQLLEDDDFTNYTPAVDCAVAVRLPFDDIPEQCKNTREYKLRAAAQTN